MPLLRRRPVHPLPVPAAFHPLPPDADVFYMDRTGEVFVDFDSYSARFAFYSRKIFQSRLTGKADLSFFDAWEDEQEELELVHSRFPDELKARVLQAVAFQMDGRLDALIERVYARFVNRYFAGERVFLDLQGERYFARIDRVFPPKRMRDSLRLKFGIPSSPLKQAGDLLSPDLSTRHVSSPKMPAAGPSNGFGPSASCTASSKSFEREMNANAHLIGTDLNLTKEVADEQDEADEYLYTVQLMDENRNFEGSFMEVKPSQMSRDRLCYSKSILKRYVKECIVRKPAIGSHWEIKSAIALQYGLATDISPEMAEKNEAIRDAKLSRRRKKPPVDEVVEVMTAAKRRKKAKEEALAALEERKEAERKERDARKLIKYPIEDLELDPRTVIDGRMLRRISGVIPDLPRKPPLHLDLAFEPHIFERFLTVWNFLNVFGRAIHLSSFTLDDFADAMRHPTHDPPCQLLGDIHGTLVGHIGSSNDMRAPGTISCTSNSVLPLFAASEAEELQLGIQHREHWIREALGVSKGWDRGAKRKGDEVRHQWEMRVTGALCQRGGCETLPSLGRLMRQLYASYGDQPTTTEERDPPEEQVSSVERFKVQLVPAVEEVETNHEVIETTKSVEEDDEEVGVTIEERADLNLVHQRYPFLDMVDKLDILEFLCGLVRESKSVKNAIEEADTLLTELRKDRADLNREKKQAMEDLAAQQQDKSKESGDVVNGKGVDDHTNGKSLGDEDVDELEQSDVEVTTCSPRVSFLKRSTSSPAASIEIDELDPSITSSMVGDVAIHQSDEEDQVIVTNTTSRRATLAAKAIQREIDLQQKRQASTSKRKLATSKRLKLDVKKKLEDDISKLNKREEYISREFRRWSSLVRTRCLGMDRFYCKYWWFDGIGGMNLMGAGGNCLWYTGKILVTGPNLFEYESMCEELGGVDCLKSRRLREEGSEESILEPGQWGWYGDESDIDSLLLWLNAKGIRELSLRTSLKEWKDYIVAGMKRRQKQQEELEARLQDEEESTRRSVRAKVVPSWMRRPYMNYTNRLSSGSKQ